MNSNQCMVNYKKIPAAHNNNCKIITCKTTSFAEVILLLIVSLFSFSRSHAQLAALQKVPSTAAPGSSFIVKISINRGPVNGFMKLSQPLPSGYSAVELDSKDGDFRYENNETKIIWLKAPAEVTYTVTYKVKIPKNASGILSLGGKITYVTNKNERKVFDFPIKKVTIANTPQKASSRSNDSESENTIKNSSNNKSKEKTSEIESAITKGNSKATSSTPPQSKTNATTPVKRKYGFRKGGLEEDLEHEPETSITANSGKKFKVQIGAFRQTKKINNVPEHTTVVVGDVTKHFSGNFYTYAEATERKNQMIELGYKDAFIVTFQSESGNEHPKPHVCKNWWHCLKANVLKRDHTTN